MLAPVVTETLKSTLSPSSLTTQVSMYDDAAEGDHVPLHEGSGEGDGEGGEEDGEGEGDRVGDTKDKKSIKYII